MKRIKYTKFVSGIVAASVFTLCLFVLNISCVNAQSKITENLRDSTLRIPVPKLNGHKFITNQMVKDPFVRTYMRNSLGYGQTIDFETPLFTVNGNRVVSLKGDMLFASLDFEYQQEIRDWLAVSGRVQVVGRMGSQMQALFTSGVNVASNMELGWLVKLMENRNMALSTNLKVQTQSVTLINMYDFIQEVIDSGKITPDNKLVSSTPLTRVLGGLRYAYAFNKVFGTNAIFELGYGSAVNRAIGDEWMYNFGFGFDADIMPATKVPLGFAVAYANTSYQSSEDVIGRPQSILFQLNYTGRDDIELGLGVNYQWYQEKRFNNTIQFVNMAINMKYYF